MTGDAVKRARETAKATIAAANLPLGEIKFDVPCDACLARPGQRCISNQDGSPFKEGHSSRCYDQRRFQMSGIITAALTAAAADARRAALREIYRELATLAEQPLSEELVALVGKRGEISSHDVLQIGWASAFNSVQAIMKRALAALPPAPETQEE